MPIIFKENIPLAPYTIYRIGGPARFFVEVKNEDELIEALGFAKGKGLPFFMIGAGSNTLVSDKGFDGVVIHRSGGEVRADGERLTAASDVMMAQAVLKSVQAGLMGFEWGIGVPGTIGGSVRGNAGCFGGEMKDVVEKVSIFNSQSSKNEELQNSECEFAYRDSIFKKHPAWIILSAVLKLSKGDSKTIQEAIQRITRERIIKQDIGTKSCGCIFKNVSWDRVDKNKVMELAQFRDAQNIPASFLIDTSGGKGLREGPVFVSPKHANYFVNEGSATAEQVRTLIVQIKELVHQKFGILLQEEIQYLGF